MDPADEQDVENPGGGSIANGANGTNHGTNGTNGQHQTPEGSLYQEENESDLDLEDAQEDEELLSPPPPLSRLSQSLDGSTNNLDLSTASIAHLNSLISAHHPFMSKLRSERGDDVIQGRSLEVLQALNNGNFVFPPVYMAPQQHPPLQTAQNNHVPVAGSIANQAFEMLPIRVSSPRASSSSASQANESSPLRCRNNGESSQGNSKNSGETSQGNTRNNGESSQGCSRNNGEARDCETRAASVNSQHPSGANWSFEEQFRQLYELDNTVERRMFLDNLFSFMQERGTPISRLPIMAKSVLDLYELYKLVVDRGGLVEVINKKLWQEIIKGLRLPASITSAAFTLRTQYMKYLYPYEREKEGLSTQEQLQTAIETNRRESRRNNYAYSTNNDNLVPRNQHNSLPQNAMQLPLSIAQTLAVQAASESHVNGHPHVPQHHPQHLTPNMATNQISEYMLRMLGRGDRSTMSTPSSMIPGNPSTSTPEGKGFAAAAEGFKSGLPFWNLYSQSNSNIYAGLPQTPFSPSSSQSPSAPTNSPEPQREALDLANSGHRSESISSPTSRSASSPSGGDMKRNPDNAELSSPASKRILLSDDDGSNMHSVRIRQQVNTRESGRKELEVSIDIDGILYEGILPIKQEKQEGSSIPSSPTSEKHNRSQNDSGTF